MRLYEHHRILHYLSRNYIISYEVTARRACPVTKPSIRIPRARAVRDSAAQDRHTAIQEAKQDRLASYHHGGVQCVPLMTNQPQRPLS